MNKIKTILCTVLLLISVFSLAQDFPGIIIGGSDNDQGLSLCLDNNNDYVIIGNTRSQGSGSNDIIIRKLSKNGETQWQQLYGGVHHDFGT